MDYQTYSVTIENYIAHVRLNNPKKANAMEKIFWEETKELFTELNLNTAVRVVVLSGEGKHFSSGIDLTLMLHLQQEMKKFDCEGRQREYLRLWIKHLQENFTAIEQCRKPVIAAIKGACIGGAIDMITACDMRYATEDAYFSVREIDLGIVADLGTLQRLSGIVSQGVARELAFTGKTFDAKEAKNIQLVNEFFADETTMMDAVMQIATTIAQKSPLTIRGTKEILNYSKNHSTAEGLDYVATWNAAMLVSADLKESVSAYMQKRTPTFNE